MNFTERVTSVAAKWQRHQRSVSIWVLHTHVSEFSSTARWKSLQTIRVTAPPRVTSLSQIPSDSSVMLPRTRLARAVFETQFMCNYGGQFLNNKYIFQWDSWWRKVNGLPMPSTTIPGLVGTQVTLATLKLSWFIDLHFPYPSIFNIENYDYASTNKNNCSFCGFFRITR